MPIYFLLYPQVKFTTFLIQFFAILSRGDTDALFKQVIKILFVGNADHGSNLVGWQSGVGQEKTGPAYTQADEILIGRQAGVFPEFAAKMIFADSGKG